METWGGSALGAVKVKVDMGLLRLAPLLLRLVPLLLRLVPLLLRLAPLLLRTQVFAYSALQFDLCDLNESHVSKTDLIYRPPLLLVFDCFQKAKARREDV